MALNEFKLSARKEDIIGLENVDNTKDTEKPISNAQEARFKTVEKSIVDLQSDINDNIETSIQNVEKTVNQANADIKTNATAITNINTSLTTLGTDYNNRTTRNENLRGAYDVANNSTGQIQRKTGYYVFTGKEEWSESTTNLTTQKCYELNADFLNMAYVDESDIVADIVCSCYKTISYDDVVNNVKGIAVDGYIIYVYDPSIQTLSDVKKFMIGQCLQYKSVTNYAEPMQNYYQYMINNNNMRFLNDEFNNTSNLIDNSKIVSFNTHVFGTSGLSCNIPKGTYYLKLFNCSHSSGEGIQIRINGSSSVFIDDKVINYYDNIKKIVFDEDITNLSIYMANTYSSLNISLSKYPMFEYKEYKGEIIHKNDLIKYLEDYIAEAMGGEY